MAYRGMRQHRLVLLTLLLSYKRSQIGVVSPQEIRRKYEILVAPETRNATAQLAGLTGS